jgi:hypothetical protein
MFRANSRLDLGKSKKEKREKTLQMKNLLLSLSLMKNALAN